MRLEEMNKVPEVTSQKARSQGLSSWLFLASSPVAFLEESGAHLADVFQLPGVCTMWKRLHPALRPGEQSLSTPAVGVQAQAALATVAN